MEFTTDPMALTTNMVAFTDSLIQDNDHLMTDLSTTTDYDEYADDMGECDTSSVRVFQGYFIPPLYWIIVVLGGIGNLAVVCIYAHFKQRLKTMTDVYLLNLAVADLIFLGTLPFWASEATSGWIFGLGICKLNRALYKINLFSSMLLLTCISVDRYVVIVETTKAQNSKRERLNCSKLVCVCVWLLALLMALPEFIFATASEGKDCKLVYHGDNGNYIKILVLSLQISIGFCLPFLAMAFCYTVIICTLLKTRNFEKHKALRVILAVVIVFVLSQLPYNGMLVMEATQATNITHTCPEKIRAGIITQVLRSLAYTHACLNPFLYAFVGVRFRRDVVRLLQACHCWPTNGKVSNLIKHKGVSLRASVMSDTDTTQALSL